MPRVVASFTLHRLAVIARTSGGGVCVRRVRSCGVQVMAIIAQQKGIGENFSDHVGVKKLVGVNSITIRAIRKILMKPGVSLAKVGR